MGSKIKVEMSRDNQLMSMYFYGPITFKDLEESYNLRTGLGDGKIFPKMKVLLMDYTEADASYISVEDAKKDLELAKEASKINPDLIIIGILPRPIDFGTARMWGMLGKDIPWTTYNVKRKEEAEALLKDIFS